MGIKKLRAFMIEQVDCFVSVNLKQSKVVIDGYCFCYCLHSGIAGSNYYQFYNKVMEYFRMLKSKGLEMFIVLDGINFENTKHRTKENRCQTRLERLFKVGSQVEKLGPFEPVLPLLAKTVFVDALCDLSTERVLKFFVADGKADRETVALANHFWCPVLGNDADYFILNIEGGYISVVDSQRTLIDLTGDLQCFKYRLFDQKYGLISPQDRLLLPFFLGNDFREPNSIPRLGIDENTSVEDIVLKIRGVNIEDYSGNLHEYCSFYEVDVCSFEELSTSRALFPKFSHFLPEWVFCQYKSGQFLNNTMSFLAGDTKKLWRYLVVVEDLSKSSAWVITDSILSYIAGALLSHGPSSVQLVVKANRNECSCEISEKPIELLDKHKTILAPQNLTNVPEMAREDRKRVLLRVFHCKGIYKTLEKVPERLKLVVIATRCWFRNTASEVDEVFILALISCLQTCFEGRVVASGSRSISQLSHIHCLAQWECMWYMAITFNQILACPFEYTSPGRLFSFAVFERLLHSTGDNLDETGDIMFKAITKKILASARNDSFPQTESIPTQNRFPLYPHEFTHQFVLFCCFE